MHHGIPFWLILNLNLEIFKYRDYFQIDHLSIILQVILLNMIIIIRIQDYLNKKASKKSNHY